ncbi:MAG: serine/threonine protein kinase, partial [Planctomycetaceae bacterium]|nr:serine/threonine protein kinase [Planctomycetaceae bacterium]
MKTQQCPTDQELRDFHFSKTSFERGEEICDHLESCEACSSVLDAMDGENDDLLLRIREKLPEEMQSDDSEMQDLLAKVKQQQNTASASLSETIAELPLAVVELDQAIRSLLARPELPDEIGRLGGYRVLEILGVGGMGIVFRAEDPSLNRPVALKVMKPEEANSSSAKERFLREAQAAATIEHDHIVPIYQVGEDQGVPFLAMSFLRGESLSTRLEREQTLAVEETLRIGREIACGLGVAHQAGLIHRDIKPDNIWLEEGSGRVKIVDFGLVRNSFGDGENQKGLTQSGMVLGTPQYMSPEQARGKPVDPRADLFSLGVVMYQMLSGKKIFQRESLLNTLVAVEREAPPPLSNVSRLPKSVSDLVMKLLEKNPDKRIQTAVEVAQSIAKLETEQLPVPTEVATKKRTKRSQQLVLGAVGALVLLGIIVITIRDKNGKE